MLITVTLEGDLAYRAGATTVFGNGRTFGDLLDDLDRQYPGFRTDVYSPSKERIRDNIFIYAGERRISDLHHPLLDGEKVDISVFVVGG